MSIDASIIDRTLASKQGLAALHIAEVLQAAGHECLWVGGAVRDMVLGNVPHEIDMAVSCLPEEVVKKFPKSDASAAELGTVVVSEKGSTFELTTFREDDAASDGRHPESVRFGDRAGDAARRDATVNAIYWDPVSGKIEDPFDGQKDLKEKLVRLIGEPEIRLQHDALRILRLVRLRALIDGQYEPTTYKALSSCAHLTSDLSGIRVLQELQKILMNERANIALEDLWEIGVLKKVLPELHACKGIAQPKEFHQEGDVWEHLKKCVASCTDDHSIDVRLAALLHDIGKVETFSVSDRIHFNEHAQVSAKIAAKILTRLQMPKARLNKIHWLIEHHMMMNAFKDLSDERKAYWYFHPWFQELLQLFWLDIEGSEPSDFSLYDNIISDYDQFLNQHPRPAKKLLSGDDVMKILGVGPGEEVGKALQALQDAQIRKEVTTKAEAKAFLKK